MNTAKTTATNLGIIGTLYFSQGIPNGFFRHTVPVIFRENGLSLEQIALFLPVLYIPWILKFLWGPIVERFHSAKHGNCLLYTSDAADEEDSVDLGGRRIIKKKN